MKKILFLTAVLVFCLYGFLLAAGEKGKALDSIEVLTGYAHADLHEKGDYSLIPLIVDFNYDLKPLTQRIGFNPPIILQAELEPFINTAFAPEANVELGNAFMLKLGLLPEHFKFQPFMRAGVGMLYMTQHTREQSTQFNFLEQGGIGAHYFINDRVALTVEGRYRHVSNSGIDHPNHGINTYFALAGILLKFE
jgi:hypothetical protein